MIYNNIIIFIYDQYSKVPIPRDDQQVIKGLSANESIVILKQDKGRGVVIVDKSLYVEKANLLLDSNKFKKLNEDPTPRIEGKVQRALREIKQDLEEKEYKQFTVQQRCTKFPKMEIHHIANKTNCIEHCYSYILDI